MLLRVYVAQNIQLLPFTWYECCNVLYGAPYKPCFVLCQSQNLFLLVSVSGDCKLAHIILYFDSCACYHVNMFE